MILEKNIQHRLMLSFIGLLIGLFTYFLIEQIGELEDQDKVGSRYKFRRSCFGFIDREAPGKICETSNTSIDPHKLGNTFPQAKQVVCPPISRALFLGKVI